MIYQVCSFIRAVDNNLNVIDTFGVLDDCVHGIHFEGYMCILSQCLHRKSMSVMSCEHKYENADSEYVMVFMHFYANFI